MAEARALWVVYHDFSGLPRSKVIPANRADDVFRDGVSFNKANWDVDINGALVKGSAYGAGSGDFWAVPDLGSLVALPHRPGVVQAFAWLHDEAGEWAGDPRGRLRAQARRLADLGYKARVGLEVEFVLLDPEHPTTRGRTGSMMFSLAEVDATWAYWDRVLAALRSVRVPLHQLGREFGDGQFEISLLPAEPVTACDQLLLARQLIKAMATDHGWVASFMPKPSRDQPGNGLHVHLSLTDLDGRDVMTDPSDPDLLSPIARRMLGGLLAHARGQTGIGCSTVNSYRRLRPGSWAPAHVSWGVGNRAVLVRVPDRRAPTHLEYRAGDASSNLYLHLAGLLASVIDGLTNSPMLPEATSGDVLTWTDEEAAAHGVQRLPASLEDALEDLAGDGVLRTAIGEPIVEHFLAVKANELAALAGAPHPPMDSSDVTPWETETYFAAL
jgi:glutamine synthetase